MKEDLISRQDAIDAINALHDKPNAWLDCAVDAVMALPSAQPEIIRCRDCKHHWIYKCMDSMPSEVCDLDQTFYNSDFDFCSLAERRTDERTD